MSHVVTLAKPDASQTKYGSPDFFDRGERIILVDGARWGRTKVEFHGIHGPSYTFVQDGGDTIIDHYGYKGREHYVTVRSPSKRHAKVWTDKGYALPADWKDAQTLVLEKAQELVANGKLRHPDVVREEKLRQYKAREARHEAAQKREDAAFRARASIAVMLSVCDPGYSDALDRVIAAMRWAQEQ